MPVKSLVELCIQVCQKHISELTSVGDGDFLLYSHVRPILLKVTNPAQLREIEINSPHIQADTGELWQRFIQKEFPAESREKNWAPKDPRRWYKVYEKYAMERKRSREKAERMLQARIQGLQSTKGSRVSLIVNQRLLPKPPKEGRNLGARPLRGGRDLPSKLTFGAGSRIKVRTAADVMKKARREAAEIANIRTKKLSTISGEMPTLGRVTKVNAALARDHRIAAMPSLPLPPMPRKEDREKVEKAEDPNLNYISDASSDGEEQADPLFDDDEPPIPRHRATAAADFSSPIKTASSYRTASSSPIVRPVTSTTNRRHGEVDSHRSAASTSSLASKLGSSAGRASSSTARSSPSTAKPPNSAPPRKVPTGASARSTPTHSAKSPPLKPLASENKRRGGILSNAHRPRIKEPASPTSQPNTSTSKSSSKSSPSILQPPPLLPSSLEELPPPRFQAEPALRKRKAVDVFMRPKRRH